MKLKKLLKDLPVKQIKGTRDLEITGICSNSKLIAPGNLFIAKQGHQYNGAAFIPEAINAGAAAVLTDMVDPSLRNITQIIDPNIDDLEALLIPRFYEYPGNKLFLVGITGTNGKTTTAFLIKHLLDALHGKCGLIGTIEYIIGDNRYQATRTTPDLASNYKMLKEMTMNGCRSAVMEVTSHGLEQKRVHNLEFDVAVFTNLTLDHLDYHKTMENYFDAKKKLFLGLNQAAHPAKKSFIKTAVINADSPYAASLLACCHANKITYGIERPADLKAGSIELSPEKTCFLLEYRGRQIPCEIPFIGTFNIYNYLAAVAVGLSQKFPLDSILEILESAPQVPGRLERVQNALNLNIFVDFAHTDDALKNVLATLSSLKKGRIITVFGCGGDRDRSKRPKMAQVAEQFSDYTIVTSDNPRTEDPAEICNQIAQGFLRKNSFMIVLDRTEAIKKAIEMADESDILLIAGKGHENYQIFAHKTIPFEDRKIAIELCEIRRK